VAVAIPQSKTELLAQIDEETAVWDRLLAEVGEERMLLPGATDAWTFKDVMTHLIGWRRRTLARLEAAQQGTEPPPPPWPAELDDDDTINAWIYEQNRDRPLADVLAESREQFRRMRELTAAIPEDALLDPNRFAWIKGWPLGAAVNSFIHLHEEHEPTLRAWLAAQQ
jgi:hypothetical protein